MSVGPPTQLAKRYDVTIIAVKRWLDRLATHPPEPTH